MFSSEPARLQKYGSAMDWNNRRSIEPSVLRPHLRRRREFFVLYVLR